MRSVAPSERPPPRGGRNKKHREIFGMLEIHPHNGPAIEQQHAGGAIEQLHLETRIHHRVTPAALRCRNQERVPNKHPAATLWRHLDCTLCLRLKPLDISRPGGNVLRLPGNRPLLEVSWPILPHSSIISSICLNKRSFVEFNF